MRDRYQILMIDPPWDKVKSGRRSVRPNQGRKMNYATMPTKEIFMLLDEEVFSQCSMPHCVFMWTIEQFLLDCEKYMMERNYKRHCRIIWDKQNGIAPAFTVRYSHEYLIWYYKPKLLHPAKEYRGTYKTVFTAKSREHSRKPDFAYEMVEKLYPGMSKLDVFSREKREHWHQFGNEINYFNHP